MTFFSEETMEYDIKTLSQICEKVTVKGDYPLSAHIEKNVVIYDGDTLRQRSDKLALKTEFAHVLRDGPGVLVIKNAWKKMETVDEMTQVFAFILDHEATINHGDHFASKDAVPNGRIWNVFQKSALINPEVFIAYYTNPVLRWVSEAWLGSGYQVTAQVNMVYPGGKAQQPHRDYHMGFQRAKALFDFPKHVHHMTPMLTLQGAVAHSDMPIESGPTLLLPYSQQLPDGYFSIHQSEFNAYFQQHAIQLPLEKGDAVFFNPALFHAAGENNTRDLNRCANLLQISSIYGRAMETVNHFAICDAVFDTLAQQWHKDALSIDEKTSIITAVADCYAFPSNLDRDPPVKGMAPATMADLLEQALAERWKKEVFIDTLTEKENRKRA
ncbi:phytanoyl-CoA dioxygenase family protein [Veronia pacifica]|uniref:Phytanoyl-CoA dioxygenase n=1 Tax=Veronia pacifica TaxID=1080227 RepID=A0A1C3EMQ6_9GAMM|nr:phytanoyl-CoA dioxygenase family protein [Veronia pacifica]ODA34512.1 hypothetical protein A8L45_05955 [Veronia pacifica]